MAGIVETTYAKSLFEVAAELDKLEVIGQRTCRRFKNFVRKRRLRPFIILLPPFPRQVKPTSSARCSTGKTDGCLLNFLKVLAQNGGFLIWQGLPMNLRLF